MTSKNTTSLVQRFANKYSVESNKLLQTLKATAFKQSNNVAITNEQLMALLVVAEQYNLNPFTKEIYAFPDKNSGIVPVIGVDGWSKILNDNPMLNGMYFIYSDSFVTYEDAKPCNEWVECVLKRKDREHPVQVREYLDEVYREGFKKGNYTSKGPWQTHTKRMLRHKALIQCARLAFGFAGIYDTDEAERIIEAQAVAESNKPSIKLNGFTRTGPKIEAQQNNNFSKELNESFSRELSEATFSIPNESQHEFIPANQSEGTNSEPERPMNNEYENVQDDLGISMQDKKFILQLVAFAKQSGSWETTLDNFKERYSGKVFDYAKRKLDNAYKNVNLDI